jgi:hypothetical protein
MVKPAAGYRPLAYSSPEAVQTTGTVAHDEAIAAMGKAELAATKGDTAGSLRYLRSAGSWAARVATELSAAIVAKLIESKLGG